jgi:octaprenyl-diphosphate synthase
LGKPVFTDLREGKLTLPLLLLKEANPQSTQALIEDFWSVNSTQLTIDSAGSRLKTLLHQHQTLDQTYDIAKKETEKAMAILNNPAYEGGSFHFFRLLPNLLLDRLK